MSGWSSQARKSRFAIPRLEKPNVRRMCTHLTAGICARSARSVDQPHGTDERENGTDEETNENENDTTVREGE